MVGFLRIVSISVFMYGDFPLYHFDGNRMKYQVTEADTCRTFITPALQEAGWDALPHLISEQHYFTDGRIIITGRTAKRREG